MPKVPLALTSVELAQQLTIFLTEHPNTRIEESGLELFDLHRARYSISTEHNRCLLHLWSQEQNLVRTVIGLRARAQSLQVETKRLGQPKPQTLTFKAAKNCSEPTARNAVRRDYLKRLMRQCSSQFECRLDSFSTSLDMEQGFGPAYARGLLMRGTTAWAVVGVNEQEDASTIANAVTVAILWLHSCRERLGGRRMVEGVRLVLPQGKAQVARERLGWLNHERAKWELYEWDESLAPLASLAIACEPAPALSLREAANLEGAQKRLVASLHQLRALLPKGLLEQVELRPESSTAIELRRNGLGFAWVKQRASLSGIGIEEHIGFGRGRIESELPQARDSEAESGLDRELAEAELRDLAQRLLWTRQAEGNPCDPLYRLQPEAWLAAQIQRSPRTIDPRFNPNFIYGQIRELMLPESNGMEHCVTVTQKGQLAVLALSIEENLHWPMAALDCWMRVRALRQTAEWQKRHYFAGVELAESNPLLYLLSPALRLHSSYPVVLSYLSPSIDWQVVGLDERWRKELNIILRRRKDSSTPIPRLGPQSALPEMAHRWRHSAASQRTARPHQGSSDPF